MPADEYEMKVSTVVATACALYVLAAAVFGNARPGQGLSEVNSG